MAGPGFSEQYDDLGLGQRLLKVFSEPGLSFAAVRQYQSWQDWLVPVALVCLVGSLAHFLIAPITLDPEAPAVRQRLEQLEPEAKERALREMQMVRSQGPVMIAISSFTSLVAVAVALMAFSRWLFKSQVTYLQMLTVKAYASLVVGIEWVLRAVLTLTRGDDRFYLGPGALVPDDMAAGFVKNLLLAINMFDLWQAYIAGVGLAVMVGIPSRKGIAAVLGLLLLWLVCTSLIPRPEAVPL